MKRIIYCLLLTVLIVSSCTLRQTDAENRAEISLQGECFEPENIPFMRMPFRIGLSGSRLVLLDLASDSCFYHVLEYPSFNYLYSVGRKGQGENEITLSTPFQLQDDHLYIFDGSRGDVYKYGLGNGGLEKKYATTLVASIDFAYKNDSTFYVEDMSGKSRVIEWNPQQRNSYFEMPTSGKETTEPRFLPYVWRSYMDYNPNLKKLALATQHGEVIELYDMEKSETHLICENKDMYPTKMNECKGYNDLHWVNNELYVLYTEETSKERDEQLKKSNKRIDGGNILKVFNSDGVLKRQYKLDAYINGFTVDTKNHKLIGITSNSDEFICVWQLEE